MVLVAVWALGAAACWPPPTTHVDPEFARGATPVRTIDVLPIDVEVFSDPADGDRWATLPAAAVQVIERSVASRLDDAGFAIASMQTWDGGQASDLPPRTGEEVQAICDSLAAYARDGHSASTRPRDLELARPLAETSAADATLYVGGWISTGPHVGWADIVINALDATATIATIATIAAGERPRWVILDGGRRTRDRPRIYLAAILLDNATGRILWRAHRTVEPGGILEGLERDVREILAQLPAVR
jgi:hypothetical protein